MLRFVQSHPSDKNKVVARIHPTNEDLFAGAPEDGAPNFVIARSMHQWSRNAKRHSLEWRF